MMKMFLGGEYILANELVQKMGINIANISMLLPELDDDYGTMIKLNNCTMIKGNSRRLPENIKNGISANTFTDMSNKLPCTFTRNEYEITEKELIKGGIITGKVKVAGKEFYEFTNDFVQKTKNKIVFTVDEDEAIQRFNNNEINEFIQVGKNKFIIWM